MRWEADHTLSRVQAEALGISQAEQDRAVAPAHASCNHKHGAKLGNQLRAQSRTETRTITPIKRKVEFLEEAPEPRPCAPQVFSPATEEDSQEAQDDS
jgi:hypothetical protein